MERIHLNIIFIIMLLFGVFSCTTKKNTLNPIVNQYKIESIDSLNNYYVVYISSGDKRYKVVSEKTQSRCLPIKVSNTYASFMFHPLINENDYIPKDKPANYLDFVPNEIKLDVTTIIKRDRGMDNIYSTPNLSGLCYQELSPLIKK